MDVPRSLLVAFLVVFLATASAVLLGQGTAAPPRAKPATPATPTPQAKPEPPALEQPADFKAYNEAMKTTDAMKKLEALQKFVADNPDSVLVTSAESEIQFLSLRVISDATKRYLAIQEKRLKANEASGTPAILTYYMTASELLRNNVMLGEAERFATKGLAQAGDAQKYIDLYRAARKNPPPSKLPPNTSMRIVTANGVRTATLVARPAPATPAAPPTTTDDDLREQYTMYRGVLRLTLAQIYAKRGKAVEAEKLLKEMYADPDPDTRAQAARELVVFARKAGDDRALLEYLTVCVSGGGSAALNKELEEIWKKAHNGSTDGLEAMLDERYAKAMPKIEVKPFERVRTKDSRSVLAELFTGSECPPCVGMDLAFDAALERYQRQDLALLVYHVHIPGPDPMTNAATDKRLKYYGIRGVPGLYIDGKSDDGGGASSAGTILKERIGPVIDKAADVKPQAKIDLKATTVGSTIKVKAGVSKVISKSNQLRLRVVLAEERVKYPGGNGIRYHSMVVRAMAGADANGFAVPAARGARAEWTFDLAKILAENTKAIDEFLSKPYRGGTQKPTFTSGRRDAIDPSKLVVVAFLQDEDPSQGAAKGPGESVPLRVVLQSASVKVPAPGPGKKTAN
jgi:hypothetical protein